MDDEDKCKWKINLKPQFQTSSSNREMNNTSQKKYKLIDLYLKSSYLDFAYLYKKLQN